VNGCDRSRDGDVEGRRRTGGWCRTGGREREGQEGQLEDPQCIDRRCEKRRPSSGFEPLFYTTHSFSLSKREGRDMLACRMRGGAR
jgi:hypothetical protein